MSRLHRVEAQADQGMGNAGNIVTFCRTVQATQQVEPGMKRNVMLSFLLDMDRLRLNATALLALYTAGPASADDGFKKLAFSCKPVEQIHFRQGTSRAHFQGSIDRFHDACFSFSASKGQRLDLDVVDFNNAADIAVYEPGFAIGYGNYTEDGKYTVWGDGRIPTNTYGGNTLTPSAEHRSQPLQSFSAAIPRSGIYLIVIDLSDAGASTFGGKISIR